MNKTDKDWIRALRKDKPDMTTWTRQEQRRYGRLMRAEHNPR